MGSQGRKRGKFSLVCPDEGKGFFPPLRGQGGESMYPDASPRLSPYCHAKGFKFGTDIHLENLHRVFINPSDTLGRGGVRDICFWNRDTRTTRDTAYSLNGLNGSTVTF